MKYSKKELYGLELKITSFIRFANVVWWLLVIQNLVCGYGASAFVVILPETSRSTLGLQTRTRTRAQTQTAIVRFSTTVDEEATSSDTGDFSFFDEASIYVRAGSGGQGSSTYKKAKKGANGIPDGGSGGWGGNIVLTLDPSLNTLAGLNRRALRPNAFGGGGAAASSKRMGHQNKQGGGDDVDESKNCVNSNNFVVRERLFSFRAKDGGAGGRMYDNGRGGEDCEVLVPPGTVVKLEFVREKEENEDTFELDTDIDTDADESLADLQQQQQDEDEDDENFDLMEIGTITYENPTLILAKGGKGGEGTATLKGKKKGATRRSPMGGERYRVRLTLKIVADIALVGVPNAGKSTFLAAVTRAKPRIADYPFTTVIPNLGTWIPDDMNGDNYNTNRDGATTKDRRGKKDNRTNSNNRAAGSSGLVLCDVPGLIAGASEGAGLGHAFLRHIERCRVILHLIDATGDDPVGDLSMVNEELKRYGTGNLANKPQVVIVNKIDAAFGGWQQQDDLGDQEEDEEEMERIIKNKKDELATRIKEEMGHTRLMWVSAKEKEGVDDLMTRMASYVSKMKEEEAEKLQLEQESAKVVANNATDAVATIVA